MRSGRAEVGCPARGRHLRGEPLELTAPDVFEVLACGVGRSVLVEKDGHSEALGDGSADVLGERHAVGHRDVLDRDERHDVDSSEPGMLTAVLAQVDRLDGDSKERQGRCFDCGGISGEREDRPVVRRVGRMVEQADAWGRANRLRQALDDLGPAALTDIRDGFDDRHATLFVTQAFDRASRGGFLFDAAPPAVP